MTLPFTSEAEQVKAQIAALKARFAKELIPLVAKLSALEEKAMRVEGSLDLDPEAEAMEEHLKQMM